MLAAAAALLLAASGAAKLRHPTVAAQLMTRLVPRFVRTRRCAESLVRFAALGEVTVGLVMVVVGARPAAVLLAGGYLTFTAVTIVVLLSGRTRISCGCFGSADSPVGPAHVVLNIVCCAAGVAAVVRPPGPGAGLLGDGLAVAVVGVVQAALLATLGYLSVTSLPALLTARRTLVASPSR